MPQDIYLITGATSDVGVALCRHLLENGAPDLLILAQGFGDLETIGPLAMEHKDKVHTFDVDLSDTGAVNVFLDGIEKDVGTPTHIVHLPALRVVNAKFKNFDSARFTLDMQVQVGSAAAVCRRFVPAMAKAGFGRVLFMLTSYILGIPPKNTAAYVMAKEALHGLAKSLSAEFAGKGVTVNCVAPSMMETKFLADTPQLVVQMAAEQNPMGRNATPEDVVPAMAFLLSEEARFITGITLPVTGGSA